MKKSVRALSKTALAVFTLGVIATATLSLADPPPRGGNGCPRLIFCADYMDPVICDNGQTYANPCYAYRACATGCVPTGGGPVPEPMH